MLCRKRAITLNYVYVDKYHIEIVRIVGHKMSYARLVMCATLTVC